MLPGHPQPARCLGSTAGPGAVQPTSPVKKAGVIRALSSAPHLE